VDQTEIKKMNIVTPSRVSSGIVLYHDDYLEHYKMESALMKINNRPNGKRLIDKITQLSTEDKKVKINVDYYAPTMSFGDLTQSQRDKLNFSCDTPFIDTVIAAETLSHKKGFLRKGEGVGSQIRWNPTTSPFSRNGKEMIDELETSNFISLAHELVHSMRLLNGTSKANDFKRFPARDGHNEELRAIGLGRYTFKRMSENAIRAEHGIERRNEI